MRRTVVRALPAVLWIQIGILIFLVWPFVSATFRDNDQATILDSSWQWAHRATPFLHATFYNFDKQWGVFLALGLLFRCFPHADPVLAANLLTAAIASVAWIGLGISLRRSTLPLPLLLPVLLSPVLILYMPYLGTGWFSLAFLLLAFLLLRSGHSTGARWMALLLLAAAAACRGDVVLAVPALALSLMPRSRSFGFLRRPVLWFLLAAAIVPVLVGKWIAGTTIPDSNPLSFDIRPFVGFLLFGLTPALLVLIAVTMAAFLTVSFSRPRYRIFYWAVALSPFIPLAFYSAQLYTLRYLFLTVACALFTVTSPRASALYQRPSTPLWSVLLTTLTVAPWFIGLQLPVLRHPRLTVTNPTLFPTGDGKFPMGAYLGFAWRVFFRDHQQIDHNQGIWLAASSVDYRTCSDSTVPFLITPMSNFLEFAIRLQHKRPRPIDYLGESPCGLAYVDARSIVRGYRPVPRDGAFFDKEMRFVSSPENGQLIVQVDALAPQTSTSLLMADLSAALAKRDVEIVRTPRAQIPLQPGLHYVLFAEPSCSALLNARLLPHSTMIRAQWLQADRFSIAEFQTSCSGSLSGWARTVLPPYLGM